MRGEKPERWVRQTDFDNDEAVGYLADRLARLGVEAELAKLGAERGAAVTIGDVTFDFEPTGGVDESEYVPTRRGTDERLTRINRIRADERLAAKKARARRTHDDLGRYGRNDHDEAARARAAIAPRTVVKVGSSSLTVARPARPARGSTRSSTRWRRATRPGSRSSSSRPGRSPPASARSG